jgi:hypothetical protein
MRAQGRIQESTRNSIWQIDAKILEKDESIYQEIEGP